MLVSHPAFPPARSVQSGSLLGRGISARGPLLVRFGNPANSKSPVALRPLLAKGLPFIVGHRISAPSATHVKLIALLIQGSGRC